MVVVAALVTVMEPNVEQVVVTVMESEVEPDLVLLEIHATREFIVNPPKIVLVIEGGGSRWEVRRGNQTVRAFKAQEPAEAEARAITLRESIRILPRLPRPAPAA